MKKILTLLLSLTLLSWMLVLTSCDNKKDDDDDKKTPLEYSVTVVDVDGSLVSGAVVTVFRDGVKQGLKSTDANGKAVFDFAEGSYTFTITFVGKNQYAYDADKCKMTEEKSAVEICVASKAGESIELYNGSTAGIIKDDVYFVEFSEGKPTYFLYTPTVAGRYKISVDTDADAKCCYFGSPMIIYEKDISNEDDKAADGSIFMDFRSFNLNQTQYLIGVVGETDGSGYLRIEKVSELEKIPEEYPWTQYQPTTPITKFTYTGGALTNIDVTDLTVRAVYNENDGYYHLNSVNGPVLYVNLTKPSPYKDSLAAIVETQNFGYYIYDENGAFKYKLTYTDLLCDYIENADENVGVYPMTYDLALAIKDAGTHIGFFTADPGSVSNTFFGEVPITVNSWLFACCYEQ